MQSSRGDIVGSRPLTDAERRLARWMLEHGSDEAKRFLSQLDLAEVLPWRCPCGCATIEFRVRGLPEPGPGARVHVLGDFIYGEGDSVGGAFIYESGGVLKGLEVYGLAFDAASFLPLPEWLRLVEE